MTSFRRSILSTGRLGYLIAVLMGNCSSLLFAQEKEASATKRDTPENSTQVRFDLDALAKVPEVFPADDLQIDGVNSFYYRGLDYKGNATRIFAYYGAPAVKDKTADQKFPAVVLIHGGGGTAFDRWVKLWNSRGYSAIAMDLCGCIPVGTYGKWQRHEHGGPRGWDASFSQLDDPIHDQWTYQAVSAIILAHSLIRSYPEVDIDRIGVTGISWGGYLTCIVSGVDSRFQFAAPVYGCGFLGENSAWLPAFEKLGTERAGIWLRQWDPSVYLPQSKMPMLWVNGTNDFAYPMDSWQKSYRLPQGGQSLCLRVRMPHGHGKAGENPEEIRVFADSILRQGKPLIQIKEQGQTGNEVWATFRAEVPVVNAELAFTVDTGKWQERKWETLPAEFDSAKTRASAQIPPNAKDFYLNIFDDRDCVVSTQHIERN